MHVLDQRGTSWLTNDSIFIGWNPPVTNIKMLMTILVMCRVAKLVGLSRKPADPQKLTMSAIINLRGKNVVIALDKNDIFFFDKMSCYVMIYHDMS